MLKIKNKIDLGQNMWVGEIASSTFNSSKEDRIKAVTDISSVCFGRLGMKSDYPELELENFPIDITIKNNIENRKRLEESKKRLYNRLLKESAGNPSTPFEFIPIYLSNNNMKLLIDKYSMTNKTLNSKLIKYSTLIYDDSEIKVEGILTNMRTLLKAGIKEEDIPFNTPEELEGYKCIIGKFPKVAFDHIVRHRGLSINAESSRNKKYLNEVKFHYPEYWNKEVKGHYKAGDLSRIDMQNAFIREFNVKPEDATKELSCRRLMLSVWGAWVQDENTWDNLFAVREAKNTQNITKKVVDNIKELIYGK
jgi:thymidylate synthase (FAD)